MKERAAVLFLLVLDFAGTPTTFPVAFPADHPLAPNFLPFFVRTRNRRGGAGEDPEGAEKDR